MSTIDLDDYAYVANVVDVAYGDGTNVVSITSPGIENNDMLTGDVTVMPQITGDAVYIGSDLFCVIVYNNELS